MQSIARDSDESSDDEFFDAHGRWAPWSALAFPGVGGVGSESIGGDASHDGNTHGKFWVNSRVSGVEAG